MDIFIAASRAKLRFDTPKGQLSVEDLWDLPLDSGRGTTLDSVAVALYQDIKATSEAPVSFTKKSTTSTAAMAEAKLKFEVAKFILDLRVAERDTKAEADNKRETKQKLLAVLERRENAELESKSPEELRAMIAAL
jgi:phage-related minor tail protein